METAREEELLLELDKWKRLALTREEQINRLDKDNKDIRLELSEYKGATAIYKAALKVSL